MIQFDLDKIIHEKRAVTSGYHLMVARGWRILGQADNLHSPLAYSAFEFRCSIERALIELFVLIRDKKVSKSDLKAMSSFGKLQKTIVKTFGGQTRFQRTMTFNKLYAVAGGIPLFSVLDITILERFWLKLSEYCHRQLKPDETWESMGDQWLRKGYELLNEVETYLWSVLVTAKVGWVQPRTMEPEMLKAQEDFVDGRIDQATLETRFTIMGPIIAARVQDKRSRDAR